MREFLLTQELDHIRMLMSRQARGELQLKKQLDIVTRLKEKHAESESTLKEELRKVNKLNDEQEQRAVDATHKLNSLEEQIGMMFNIFVYFFNYKSIWNI